MRSSNWIQASGTRQGLISGGCGVAPPVLLQALLLLHHIQMFAAVWVNIDCVRSCEVPAYFCKHFPYYNLDFIINSALQGSEKAAAAINKRAAPEHEDASVSELCSRFDFLSGSCKAAPAPQQASTGGSDTKHPGTNEENTVLRFREAYWTQIPNIWVRTGENTVLCFRDGYWTQIPNIRVQTGENTLLRFREGYWTQ